MPDEMNTQPGQQPAPSPAPNPAQPQGAPAAAMQQVGTSGLAVAGMVLGILAFLLSFIPLMNIGSIVMGLLGLILAIIGLASTRNGKHKGRGIAIAGIVLSLLAVVITFAMYGTAAAISDSNDKADTPAAAQQEAAPEQEAEEAEPAVEQEEPAAAAEPEPEPAAEAPASEYDISIDGARIGHDYEGNEIAIVSYTWTNNSEDTTSFAVELYPKVFQNGVECDNIVISEEVDGDGYMADLKPGGTVSFEHGYAISDHSDITVEVSKLISFSDEILAEETFSLE